MAALECLRWQWFTEAENLMSRTEGKGNPKFDGSPAALQEYAFRVRLRAARDSVMDPAELKI